MRSDPRRALAVLGVFATLLAACGTRGDAAAPDAPSELVVFAAASLTEAFAAVGTAFTATEGGAPVVLNLAGSQTLAAQLLEGAPADVFAAADEVRMRVVADAGLLAATPVPFATNRLAIVVEPGNPRGVGGVADLARDALVVVLPAAEVPAGRYARQVLDVAGVDVAPASLEPDVRAAVAKVALGEADATLAYTSDVANASGRVEGVAIPDEVNVTATYPVGVLAATSQPEVAARFVAFLRSDSGREILAAHGFGAP